MRATLYNLVRSISNRCPLKKHAVCGQGDLRRAAQTNDIEAMKKMLSLRGITIIINQGDFVVRRRA